MAAAVLNVGGRGFLGDGTCRWRRLPAVGREQASSVEARRVVYFDVTRAREDVTTAHGKDEAQDFGELLLRAQRDQGISSSESSSKRLRSEYCKSKRVLSAERPVRNFGK